MEDFAFTTLQKQARRLSYICANDITVLDGVRSVTVHGI
jgi:hypothetical protein